MSLPVLTPGTEVVAVMRGGVVRGPLRVDSPYWIPGEHWYVGECHVARCSPDGTGRMFALSLRLAADVDAEAYDAVLGDVLAAVEQVPTVGRGLGVTWVDPERVRDAIVGLYRGQR